MMRFPEFFSPPLINAIEHRHAISAVGELLNPDLYFIFLEWTNTDENKQWKILNQQFLKTIENCIYVNQRVKEISSASASLESALALKILNPQLSAGSITSFTINEILHSKDPNQVITALQTIIKSKDEVNLFAIITVLNENPLLANQLDECLIQYLAMVSTLIDQCEPSFFDAILSLLKKLPQTSKKLCENSNIIRLLIREKYNQAHLFLEIFPEETLKLCEKKQKDNLLLQCISTNNTHAVSFILDSLLKHNVIADCLLPISCGYTILHLAAIHSNHRVSHIDTSCAKLILDKLKPYPDLLDKLTKPDAYRFSPLDYAIINDNWPLAELLKSRIPNIEPLPILSLWLNYHDQPHYAEAMIKEIFIGLEENPLALLNCIHEIYSCSGLRHLLPTLLKNNTAIQSAIPLQFLSQEEEPLIYSLLKPSVIQKHAQNFSDIDLLINADLFGKVTRIAQHLTNQDIPFSEFSELIDDLCSSPLIYLGALANFQEYDKALGKLLLFIKKEICFAAILPNLPTDEVVEFIKLGLEQGDTSLIKFLSPEQKIEVLKLPILQRPDFKKAFINGIRTAFSDKA